MNCLNQTTRRSSLLVLASMLFSSGCTTMSSPEEIRTEDYVDLDRFMGDWYVIASIPTVIEKNAYNAIETYALDEDGTIATSFSFRKNGFDGKKKVYTPRGFVRDTSSNAEWGMRFIWPIKADYRILHVSEDYSQTVIGRNKRDYAWVMARTPAISNADLFGHVRLLRERGYDTEALKVVPQRWDGVESSYNLEIDPLVD